MKETADKAYVSQAMERVEDAALLAGAGVFADDIAVGARTGHAAFLRSPHAHADINSINVKAAEALTGVHAVVIGEDLRAWSRPFIVGVKQPMEHWCLAQDRVRYIGEPVAIVVAEDRYVAEDALALIEVDYTPLKAVVDPEIAVQKDAPVLHEAVGSNLVSERHFSYGDPDKAFKDADRIVKMKVRYPRNACTPIECFVVNADYDIAKDGYDVLANFQGPFSLLPVMALALNIPVNKLRLRTPPDSGGSFGVKQAIFPYIVALCLAARKAGRPVKWVEDRLEHLTAATSATNRVTEIEGAVTKDGELIGLRYRQLEDCGGYLRAPEPATLYRMHGNMTGAYKVQNLAIENRVVLTNKTPTGLNRGFGGPQVYFALERLMHKIALELNLDPLEVIKRNLVDTKDMPYRTPSGALYDSGDYRKAVLEACKEGDLEALKKRRDQVRGEGGLYGIGYTAIIEPSISNMGYISTALTASEREKAGPKDGGAAMATVSVDALGSVSVTMDSTPQGQGHRTVAAQVVADVLGLKPADIQVDVTMDTAKDNWSISAGNYSSRFAGSVAGSVHLAAIEIRDKLARMAQTSLNIAVGKVSFANGKISDADDPDNAIQFRRLAGQAHWSPGLLPDGDVPGLRAAISWTMPELEAPDPEDRVNSSGAHGFVFDYCGVEINRDTGRVQIDKYVTMHDAGRLLNPALVDGQVYGGFTQALGAALYEELSYAADGTFQAGSMAEYLIPTVAETPAPVILHMSSPSPFTPLGAKGVGEGNSMSTPVCLANAVADALGRDDVELPLKQSKVRGWIGIIETPPTGGRVVPIPVADKDAITGHGELTIPLPVERVWDLLLDPENLEKAIPGCRELIVEGDHSYRADVSVAVGPVRGDIVALVNLTDLDPPGFLRLGGSADGPLGSSTGSGTIRLTATGANDEATILHYDYSVSLTGKIAAVGGRLLGGAMKVLIKRFFERFIRIAAPETAPSGFSLFGWLKSLLRAMGIGR